MLKFRLTTNLASLLLTLTISCWVCDPGRLRVILRQTRCVLLWLAIILTGRLSVALVTSRKLCGSCSWCMSPAVIVCICLSGTWLRCRLKCMRYCSVPCRCLGLSALLDCRLSVTCMALWMWLTMWTLLRLTCVMIRRKSPSLRLIVVSALFLWSGSSGTVLLVAFVGLSVVRCCWVLFLSSRCCVVVFRCLGRC